MKAYAEIMVHPLSSSTQKKVLPAVQHNRIAHFYAYFDASKHFSTITY